MKKLACRLYGHKFYTSEYDSPFDISYSFKDGTLNVTGVSCSRCKHTKYVVAASYKIVMDDNTNLGTVRIKGTVDPSSVFKRNKDGLSISFID